MTEETTSAAAAAEPRKGRHVFTVVAGKTDLEFDIDADDYEVDAFGVYIWRGSADDVVAFVSHPAAILKDHPKAEGGK